MEEENKKKDLSEIVKSYENDIISVINKYGLHPTITRLVLLEILRIIEGAETQKNN